MKKKHESPGVYIYEYSVINKHRTGKRLTREKMEQVSYTEVSTQGDTLTYKLKVIPTTATLSKNGKIELKAYLQLYRNNIKLTETDVTSECKYQSYNEGVSVTDGGVVTALKTGSNAIIKVTYEDKYETQVIINVISEVTYRLEVIPKDVVLLEGDTQQFVAKLYTTTDGVEDNGVDVTKKCTWKSSNINVSISPTGLVTITKTGVNTTITAIYNEMNGLKDTANIVVNSVSSQNIVIDGSTSISLTKGQTHQFKVKLYTITDGSSDNGIDITSQCNWSSSNSQIQVNGGLVSSSELNATTVITAEYNGMSVTANVTYSSEVKYELVIEPSSITMDVGEEKQLTAKYYTVINGVRSTYEDVTNICAWVSNNDLVPVSKGVVTAISSGQKATIYANYNNNLTSNYINISVNDKVTTRLEITPYQIVLDKDNSQQLTVKYYTSINGVETSWTDVTMSCTWEYDSSKLHLTNGKVTALVYDATDYIVAKYNGETSNTVTVTINPYVPEISYVLELTPKNIELPFGETEQLTVTKYEYIEESGLVADVGDDITEQCSWIISNDKIQVSDKGVLSSTEDNINGTIQATCEILPFGQLYTNIISVNVLPKNTYRLLIYPQELILEKDYTIPIECRYYSTINGVETYEVCTDTCIWEYDNSILKIENGNITALKSNIANTTITATYEGLTDTINVSVNSHVISELKIENGSEIELEKDFVEPLTVKYYTITDGVSDGGIDVTEECIITTSNDNVTVDKHNVVLAVTPNSNSTITAKYNNQSDTCNITIPEESPIRHMFIKVLEDDTIISVSQQPLNYSIDGGNTWLSLSPDNTTQSFNKGKVYFKQVINDTNSSYGIGTFIVNKPFHVGGNILSLITGDEMTTINSSYLKFSNTFKNLFKECTTLLKVSKTLLKEQDTLPSKSCISMFEGCENLINAPDLPEGKSQAFNHMFKNCKSLVVPPIFNQTNFSENCNAMFEGCEKLTYLNDLTIVSSYLSFEATFEGCVSLKDASNITIKSMGHRAFLSMFEGCVSLLNSPNITDKNISSPHVGNKMFYGCSNLRYIKFLAITIDTLEVQQSGMLGNWVDGVAPKGVFIMSSGAQWTSISSDIIPEGWDIIYDDMEVTATNLELLNVGDTFMVNCIADDNTPTGVTSKNVISDCSFTSTDNCIEVNEYGIAKVTNIPGDGIATIANIPGDGIATIANTTDNSNCDLTVTYKNISKTLKMNIVETIPLVEGYVRDENGLPIENVIITIYGIGNLVTTDSSGYYYINKNNALFEQESLMFIKNGYQDKIVKINGQNTIDVILITENCSETFYVADNDRVQKFNYDSHGYMNHIAIKINKSEEEFKEEFSYTYQNISEIFDEGIPPHFNYDEYQGGTLYSDFTLNVNQGKERVGYLTIRHIGGWHATIIILQQGILQSNDIPYDAYKTIIPNVTPWVETKDEPYITFYNIGKAQKVLYTCERHFPASAMLYIPGITDKTTVGVAMTEIDSNNQSTIENYVKIDVEKFNNYGIQFKIGVMNKLLYNKKYESVVITFLVRNYDNQEGNCIAIPFRIVQCSKSITKKDFDELVKIYGTSNYDGTMNDLSGFGFPPLPEPNEISVGNTHWLNTYANKASYGRCERVLYMTYESGQWVWARVNYIDMSNNHVYDQLKFSCEDGMNNDIDQWMDTNNIRHDWETNDNGVKMIYEDFGFRPRSEFKGTINNNHRVIKFNFKIVMFAYQQNLEYFNIPFTIVQCRKNITKGEFDDLVKKYGPSNYDGTMGDLSKFNF